MWRHCRRRPSGLVAQFTTSGDISGQIQVQIFYNGNNQDEFREVLPILTACNDPEALNYEPLSYSDDGCEYSEVDRVLDLVTTHELEAFPSPATTTATIAFPAHLADRLAGAELRATAWMAAWSAHGPFSPRWNASMCRDWQRVNTC